MLPDITDQGAVDLDARGIFSTRRGFETPSSLPRRCRANAIGGLVAVACQRDAVSGNLAGAIVKLLETLQLNSVSCVVKPDDRVFLSTSEYRSLMNVARQPFR